MEKQRTAAGVEPAWSTYLHTKGAARGLPIAGNFELTTRCNFGCRMCYVHDNAQRDELSAAQWIELGRQAADAGMVFLLLTGGEPLLRADFREIYTGLKQLGLLLSINTNGSLIDEPMLEFLCKDPPLRMNISLYGACEETYQRFCGLRACEHVKENILRLRDAGIQIRINSSITPLNGDDIPQLYRFAQQAGLPLKATTYMFPPVRVNGCRYGDAPARFTPEQAAEKMLLCQEQYMTAEQLARSCAADPFGDTDCSDGQGDPMHCRAGKTAFWITWDGRMLPCGMFPDRGFSVGELGFRGAWDATRARCQALRLPAKCSACRYRTVCPACAAACLAECGDLTDSPEYICRMTACLDELTAARYGREDSAHEGQ